jgi:hypothetical protein
MDSLRGEIWSSAQTGATYSSAVFETWEHITIRQLAAAVGLIRSYAILIKSNPPSRVTMATPIEAM